MRKDMVSAILGLLCAAALAGTPLTAVWAKDPPQAEKWVHLYGPADLEHLRQTNLDHYLRARKIMAAANEICKPGLPQLYMALRDTTDPACGVMWMTSWPPKKLLSFRLDNVHYLALVTVTNIHGKTLEINLR